MSTSTSRTRRFAAVAAAAIAVAVGVSACSSSSGGKSINLVAYSVPKPAYDALGRVCEDLAGEGLHAQRVLRAERYAT